MTFTFKNLSKITARARRNNVIFRWKNVFRKVASLLFTLEQLAGADPHRFPSFYGNWSDFSELLRNPKKGNLGIEKIQSIS